MENTDFNLYSAFNKCWVSKEISKFKMRQRNVFKEWRKQLENELQTISNT